MKSKKFFAFTLIELLVVIAIVGILSGFVLVSLNSATDSAKDVKTKNDLSAISRAILTYQALNNSYPIEETPCDIGNGTCLNELVPNHIQSFPLDFNNNPYHYSSDGTSFTLTGALTNDRILTYNSETGYIESNGLPGYAKRQPITINSTSALTDYQVKLTITYDSDMQPDFDDLRFTSADGTTELSYWLESKTDSTTAIVWVKVPSLASGDNTLYMYYANASATTASNGDNTFEFFDGFDGASLDTNKWVLMTGSVSFSSSVMTLSNAGIVGKSTGPFWQSPSVMRSRFRATYVGENSSYSQAIYLNPYTYTNNYFAAYIAWGAGVGGKFCQAYGGLVTQTITGYTANNWAIWEMKDTGAKTIWTIDDGNTKDMGTTYYGNPGNHVQKIYGVPTAYIDFVLWRKYAAIEPTSSFGTEQNN